MKLTSLQTKLVGLIMDLNLKTNEYKILCEKLDKLKEKNIEPNSDIYAKLKVDFEKNLKEITEINNQLTALKNQINDN